MYSKLPPEFGETPTKVVFEGVGDQRLAEQLYRQLAGEIDSFQLKARQNRTISGSPSSTMQQALPDGGQLRYQWNSGLETIYVRLSASRVERAKSSAPVEKPIYPMLAIDVLIDPAEARSSFTETNLFVSGHGAHRRVTIDQYTNLFVVGIILDPDGKSPVEIVGGPDYFRGGNDLLRSAQDPRLVRRVVGARRDVPYVGGDSFNMEITGFGYEAVSASPVIFDIYFATLDVAYFTSEVFGPPGDTWTTKYPNGLAIQAREYTHQVSGAADIQPHWGRQVRDETQLLSGPIVSDTTTFDLDGPLRYYSFLIDGGWTDPGGRPAQMTDGSMGELLAATSDNIALGTDVAGPEIPDTVYPTARWDGPVSTMTKIARLEWTPPASPTGKGSAKITPLYVAPA